MADVYFRRPDGAVVAIPREQSDAAQTRGYVPLSGADVENAQYSDRYGRVPTPEAPLSQKELFEGVKRGDVTYDYDPRQAANEKLLAAGSFGLLGPDRADPAALYRAQRTEREHPVASGVLEGAAMLGGGAAISALTGGGAALAGGGRLAQAAGWGINALGQGAQAELELSRVEGEEFSPTRAAVLGIVGEVAGHTAAWGISKGIGATRNLVARASRGAVSEQVDRAFKGGWVSDMNAAQWRPELEADAAKKAAEAFDVIEENFERVAARPKTQARVAKQVESAGDTLVENQGAARIETLNSLSKLRESLVADTAGIAAPPARAKKILGEVGNVITELEGGASKGKLWRQLDDAQRSLQGHIGELEDLIDDAPNSAWLGTDGIKSLREAEKTIRENLLREDTWGKAAVDAQKSVAVPLAEKYMPARAVVNQRFRFRNGGRVSAEQGKVLNNLVRQSADGLDPYNQTAALNQYLEGVEDIAKAAGSDDKKTGQALLDAAATIRKAQSFGVMMSETASRHASRAGKAGLVADVASGVAGAAAFGPVGALIGTARRAVNAGDWLSQVGEHLGWFKGAKPSLDDFFKKGAPHWSQHEAGKAAQETALRDILDSPVGGASAAESAAREAPSATGDAWPAVSPEEFDGLVDQLRAVGAATEDGQPLADLLAKRRVELEREGLIQGSAANDVLEAPTPRAASQVEASGSEVASSGHAPAERPAPDDLEGQLRASLDQPRKAPGAPAPKPEPVMGKARAHIRASEGDSALEQQLRQSTEALDAMGPDEVKRLQSTKGSGAADRIREVVGKHKEAGFVDVQGGFLPADMRDLKNLEKRTVSSAVPENDPAAAARIDSWRKKANPNHLSDQAFEDATRWVMTGFEDINRNPGQQAEFIRRMKPLAVANPTADGPLWRGQTLKKEQIANLVPGATVQMKNLSSTSLVEAIAGHFAAMGASADDVATIFKINKAKYGINLTPIHHTEGEVILGPGAYKVTGMGWDDGRRMLVVDIEQASAPSKAGQRGMVDLEGGKQGASKSTGMSPGQAVKAVATSPMGIVSGLGAAGVGLKAADEDTREGIGVGAAGLAAGAALWGNRAALFRLFQTQLVKSTARAMFSGARRAAPGIASRAAYTRAALAARQKEITGWQVSPEEVLARLDEGLAEAPDDAVAPVAIGTFQALQFLAQRVPRAAKLNAVSAREIPIPESSMREYALFERAALRPKEACEAAQYEGRFAPQTLEAFEQLYPDLLLELRVAAVEEIQENGAPPTIQSRLAYAQLFGGDGRIADPAFSPDITAAINAMPGPEANAPAPPANRPWGPMPSRPAGIQKIS